MHFRRFGDLTTFIPWGIHLGDGESQASNFPWYGNPESPFGSSAFQLWPAANVAAYIPFLVPNPVTISQIGYSTGNASAGNVDVGIYTMAGVRLVSSGSTAHSGSGGSFNFIAVTSTYLKPGVYYVALVTDGTSVSLQLRTWSAARMNFLGMRQEASAFPLPATATFALVTNAKMPQMLIS